MPFGMQWNNRSHFPKNTAGIGPSSLSCSDVEQFARRGDGLCATGQTNSYYKVLLRLTLHVDREVDKMDTQGLFHLWYLGVVFYLFCPTHILRRN